MPQHNLVVGGRWTADEPDALSVEEGLAQSLGLKLGDRMRFDIVNSNRDPNGLVTQFRQDVANNKLPQVSWIVAPEAYSEHPGPSSPVQGAWYVQEVLNALTANPEVWSKTVLIINYDEWGGFADHVAPPMAPVSAREANLTCGGNDGRLGIHIFKSHIQSPSLKPLDFR